MTIAQLSPTNVKANPSYFNPQIQAEKSSTPVQATLAAQKTVQTTNRDIITISSQAKQLADDMKQ